MNITAVRINRYAKRKIRALFHSARDRRNGTYITPEHNSKLSTLKWKIPAHTLENHSEWVNHVTGHYLDHRFDLLGSGWTRIFHGMQCRGLEGVKFDSKPVKEVDCDGKWLKSVTVLSNYSESARIWKLVDQDYVPLDWNIDFKSGYRWAEKKWFGYIPYTPARGADIKVPWELGRMQHLPQLVWAYILSAHNPQLLNRKSDVYLREIRNQILDFIAQNPPNYGVQWRCPMDVGIRAANWCMTYGLLCGESVEIDQDFKDIFAASLASHGRFILENLEWNAGFRGNHYLANITGLLFIAATLESTSEFDSWLALAIQEIIVETETQFLNDGANAEASTCYHRLSAEMVIWATCLINGLPADRIDKITGMSEHGNLSINNLKLRHLVSYTFPGCNSLSLLPIKHYQVIARMAEFTMHVTRRDGRVSQIGDNDSGRFFKLQPVYEVATVGKMKSRFMNLTDYSELPDTGAYYMEDSLDHRAMVAAANSFFAWIEFSEYTGSGWLDEIVAGCVSGNRKINLENTGFTRQGAENRPLCKQREKKILKEWSYPALELYFEDSPSLRDGLKVYSYPDFGLYIYRSRRLYLIIRCGPVGQNGLGGHAHCDQLSVEISVDDRNLTRDPGTYLYTPFPEIRNLYRSVISHFCPDVSKMIAPVLSTGNLFIMKDRAESKCLCFSKNIFYGSYGNRGIMVYRLVRILDNKIIISDSTDSNNNCIADKNSEDINFSPGYGWLTFEPSQRTDYIREALPVSGTPRHTDLLRLME